MTGEISLRGLVMPVGGISEKVLAARRAGIDRVILPAKNRPDVDEMPEVARKGIEFLFVSEVHEVIAHALNRRRSTRRRQALLEDEAEQ